MPTRTINSMTADELITHLSIIHNHEYAYINIHDYQKAEDIIKLQCVIHGVQDVQIFKHAQGLRCKLCNRETRAKKMLDKGRMLFFSKVGELWPTYDFSDYVYAGCFDASTVRCEIHGEFQKHPVALLKNNGCPVCSKEKTKLSIQEIKKRIAEVHSNKYTYPSLVVKTVHDYIDINCSKHGNFKQSLHAHIRGSGCPKCALENQEEIARKKAISFYTSNINIRFNNFLQKAILRFADRYDYSNVDYINS